jgi:sulfate permease, SulP family
LEGDLFFGVADQLQEQLRKIAASGVRVVILRLKRTHSIDATALAVLEQFARLMKERGGHVILCGVKPELREVLERYGLLKVLGRENVFEAGYGVFTSAKRALDRARELLGSSLDVAALDLGEESEGWAYEI